jgi:hypothetical protein
MTRGPTLVLVLGLLAVAYGLAVSGPLAGVAVDGNPTDGANATVTFVDENGTQLGQLTGPVADTYSERHTGLSDTDSLGANEGMVFAYETEGSRTFVMREMAFPLDIIFVDGERQVTAIFEAAADDDRTFTARARWVIEANRGYAAGNGIGVGDEVRGLPR